MIAKYNLCTSAKKKLFFYLKLLPPWLSYFLSLFSD